MIRYCTVTVIIQGTSTHILVNSEKKQFNFGKCIRHDRYVYCVRIPTYITYPVFAAFAHIMDVT